MSSVTVLSTATKDIVRRPVAELFLDSENPRLDLGPSSSQEAILRKMYREEALDELALSFVRNGYFWEEPLVVIPEAEGTKLIVVEGNRRLAALKLLLSASLRDTIGVSDFPLLPPDRKPQLESVPTVAYGSREEVVPYLGFRHITGVKKWDYFARSRYVARLITSGRPLAEIEEAIGDSSSAARKLYQTHIVYTQITENLGVDDKEIRARLSLLEVALGQQPIKQFLGVARKLPTAPQSQVVPEDHLDNLAEVVSWIFGNKSKGESPVIHDSREISRLLAPVLDDPEALEYLRLNRNLEEAYERSGGESQYLHKQILQARKAVERALGIAPLHQGDQDAIAELDRLQTLLSALSDLLRP